jgi:hypothetical protein
VILRLNKLKFLTVNDLLVLKFMFNANVAKLILFQSKLFPEMYTVSRSDTDCDTDLRGA